MKLFLTLIWLAVSVLQANIFAETTEVDNFLASNGRVSGFTPFTRTQRIDQINNPLRKEFWECMAKSKYATEFGELEARKMSKGFAPDAPQSQWLGVKRTSYELHHKTPISQGGAVYDLYNIEIVTPRFHKEVLEKAFHVGK